MLLASNAIFRFLWCLIRFLLTSGFQPQRSQRLWIEQSIMELKQQTLVSFSKMILLSEVFVLMSVSIAGRDAQAHDKHAECAPNHQTENEINHSVLPPLNPQ